MPERRERGRAAVEGAALGALAAVPVLPHLLRLARSGIPRFVLDGDYAGLELATRFVSSGRTLLGPYSRFQFNHPGPAYFYFLSPIYELGGRTSTAIFVGACLLNALAAFVAVFATRLVATRAHALACAFVVLAWMAAFGNVTSLPWNPLVVVLPLTAFFVLAAFFATGRAAAAPPAAALAALVTQTHLSTVPTVVVVGLASIAAFVWRTRARRERTPRRDRRWLALAAGVLLLAMTPPLVEEATSREGNLTKLVHFFSAEREPPKPVGVAMHAWMNATGWLPERALHRTILKEGAPRVMASAAVPPDAPRAAIGATLALFAAGVAALVVAARRRDHASLALVAIGLLASVTGALALRHVVGEMFHYLVFWTTAGTTVVWIGVASTFAAAAAALWESVRAPLRRTVGPLVVVAVAVLATSLQREWVLAGNRVAYEGRKEELRQLYGALTARMRERGETPVIHHHAGWNIATGLLNELARDGLDVRVDERERWILGRQFPTPSGLARPLHVYAQTSTRSLPIAACLELLAKTSSVELRVGPAEIDTCPEGGSPP